jgi:signal transduction histidine kinase
VITETPTAAAAPLHTDPPPGAAPEPDPLALRANKLDLLERLADDLAHEIKNPLHSMVINLEVLKRRVARADSADEVQRYIGVLAGELERVNRRIELLLRLSRPGRGAESTTLVELTEELLELIQLEARHAEVQVDYRPEGGMARLDLAREPVRLAILNLVLEVVDHVPAGGTLRIVVGDGEGVARLAVGDTGVALAAIRAEARSPRLVAAGAMAEAAGGRVDEDDAAEFPGLVLTLPVTRTQG